MTDAKITFQPSDSAEHRSELGLFDLMIALAKNKKLLVVLPLAVAIISTGASFALPNIYKASTTLLPPQQAQSSAAAVLSQLGGVAGMAAGVAGLKNPNDMYVAMLKSRSVTDTIVKNFDLKKLYETESQEKARKYLEDSTVITAGKDGLITIEVEDTHKKLVASLANAYVQELGRLTKVLAVTEASQRRVFFEQQLELAKNNLTTAEVSLKNGLDARGVISVDTESRAIVETVARLKAQVSAKEIQLGSMQAFVTTNHPEFKRTQEELISLRAELAALENGRKSKEGDPEQINGINKNGLANIKLIRDVKYYQMLYELLAKQYEVARLDEAKQPSIVQVLDSAVEPETKWKPKRTIIVMIATLIAFFSTTLWVFFKEAKIRAMTVPRTAARWKELTSYFGSRRFSKDIIK
jgi:uncharacterized protein involved in exopolysaccharide biosynthesis